MLYQAIFVATWGFATSTYGQQCSQFSCHGDVGNLAAGRRVVASSTCGENGAEISCDPGSETCSAPQCRRCKAGRFGHEHPNSHLTDSPFFHPRTWWQSSNAVDDVTLTFSLETTFYFTHLIMIFRSPRPGAMTIERSIDFGNTWKIYQRYARNCSESFGIEDDEEVEGASCSSRYSAPVPCHKGEVIYRVINPTNPIDDPYSDQARHLLKITNLRIRMWLPQTCPSCFGTRTSTNSASPVERKNAENTRLNNGRSSRTLAGPFTPFAVYDVIIRGTCFCNGHADTCIPLHVGDTEPSDQEQNVVHGKCICEHNTAGGHCQRCLPLYDDAPWKPGNGDTGAANPCKRCTCHGHATSCTFNPNIYIASGNQSGGVCDDCQHNTMGRHCGTCRPGYFRRTDSELSDPDVCQECLCNPVGTEVATDAPSSSLVCHPDTGQCRCKPGVGGRRCDRCLKGYWGFSDEGCRECLCGQCEQKTGVCLPDYGDDEITFIDSSEEYRPPGYDLTRGYDLPLDDRFPIPFEETQSRRYLHVSSRYPDNDRNMLAAYPLEPLVVSRSNAGSTNSSERWGVAYSWRPTTICDCKEKELEDQLHFCKMKYDYAMRVRVREATDFGSHATLSVVIRRVMKQNKVKIRRGKAVMFPESWTIMGCTCPVLLPGHEYLVIGHEDEVNGRLMINVKSIVKDWWSEGKNWSRVVKKYFKKKCDDSTRRQVLS